MTQERCSPYKMQLLPKDQLNKPWTAKVITEKYNNTKYFITFTSIVDNGRIECLTKNEFTNETYVEIKNDSKLASMYSEFLGLKNQCNGELSVQKLLPGMETKQLSITIKWKQKIN